MQHLPEKWLKRFNFAYVIYGIALLLLYVYVAIDQKTFLIKSVPELGVSLGTTIFVIIFVIYNLIFLKHVKKYNLWLAYVISYALICVANSAIIELSINSPSATLSIAITYILSALSITLGPIVSISMLAISGVVTGMVVAGTAEPTQFGVAGDILAYLIRALVIAIGLYLLRNKYTTIDNNQNYIERYFVTNEVVKLLTNSISDNVIIIDQNEIVRSINPAALKLLGQTERDVIDLNYRSVLKLKNTNDSSIDEVQEPIQQALKSGSPKNNEFLISTLNNQTIFVDVTVSVIKNQQTGEIYGAVIILRDISQKKREDTARSEFISTASHEMRTPVAAIEGYIELALNEKVSKVDENARKYLEKAKASSQHLGRLFQDLLVSAKAEDGRLSNHPTIVEIGELLEQQAEMSKMVANQKGLGLDFVISSENQSSGHANAKLLKPLYYVNVDPDRIREVATNLIDNAIKYTPKGNVTVGLTGNNEVVQFFIRDTGVGIDAEDINHLFQKFYRVDSSDTRTTGGTGLGLFIAKEIITLYNGHIWAESEKGKGTTFYVSLPRISTTQAEASLTIANSQQLNSNKAE